MCPHARPDPSLCPHCLGISDLPARPAKMVALDMERPDLADLIGRLPSLNALALFDLDAPPANDNDQKEVQP